MLPQKPTDLKIGGAEIVLGITVHPGEKGPNGERLYGSIIRGPETDHTNAEMVQCLAILATTIVFGNAAAAKLSLQQAMDEVTKIFSQALASHVHQAASRGNATQGLKTVQLDRGQSKP